MPHFLHTADWQIGRRYGRFAEEDAALLLTCRPEKWRDFGVTARDMQGMGFTAEENVIKKYTGGACVYSGPED